MPVVRLPVDISWTGVSGSPGVNVWHGRVEDLTGPFSDVDSLADMLKDFYTLCTNFYSSTTTIRYAGEAHGVGDDEGTVATTAPWSVTGTGGSDSMPPADCLLLSWRTSGGGRHGRGRTFIGPLVESTLEANGTPVETVRADLLAAANALIADSGGFANGAIGIYSREENLLRDLVSASVPNMFAVLRSRRD